MCTKPFLKKNKGKLFLVAKYSGPLLARMPLNFVSFPLQLMCRGNKKALLLHPMQKILAMFSAESVPLKLLEPLHLLWWC